VPSPRQRCLASGGEVGNPAEINYRPFRPANGLRFVVVGFNVVGFVVVRFVVVGFAVVGFVVVGFAVPGFVVVGVNDIRGLTRVSRF
jgi:hypothetical protein